jgi:transposase
MPRVTKAISDELYEQVELAIRNCQRYGKVYTKLKAIRAAKKFSIKHAATVFDVSYTSVWKWIKAFASKGVEGLVLQKGRGRKSNITDKEREIICGWIQEKNGFTINALKLKIKDELGKKVCKTRTHDLMRELGYRYITPRPVHYMQDKSQHNEFKKKSTRPGKSKARCGAVFL